MTMVGRTHEEIEMRIFEVQYFTSRAFSVRNSKGRRVSQSSVDSKQRLIRVLFLVSAAAAAGWALSPPSPALVDSAANQAQRLDSSRDVGAQRSVDGAEPVATNSQSTRRIAQASRQDLPEQAPGELLAMSEVYDVPAILNTRRDEVGDESEPSAELAPGASPDSELAEEPSTPMHQAALYQAQSILDQHIRDEELDDLLGSANGASNDVRVDPDALQENVARQPSL
jgi:hypothetical protein